jgi:hypothetical protein
MDRTGRIYRASKSTIYNNTSSDKIITTGRGQYFGKTKNGLIKIKKWNKETHEYKFKQAAIATGRGLLREETTISEAEILNYGQLILKNKYPNFWALQTRLTAIENFFPMPWFFQNEFYRNIFDILNGIAKETITIVKETTITNPRDGNRITRYTQLFENDNVRVFAYEIAPYIATVVEEFLKIGVLHNRDYCPPFFCFNLREKWVKKSSFLSNSNEGKFANTYWLQLDPDNEDYELNERECKNLEAEWYYNINNALNEIAWSTSSNDFYRVCAIPCQKPDSDTDNTNQMMKNSFEYFENFFQKAWLDRKDLLWIHIDFNDPKFLKLEQVINISKIVEQNVNIEKELRVPNRRPHPSALPTSVNSTTRNTVNPTQQTSSAPVISTTPIAVDPTQQSSSAPITSTAPITVNPTQQTTSPPGIVIRRRPTPQSTIQTSSSNSTRVVSTKPASNEPVAEKRKLNDNDQMTISLSTLLDYEKYVHIENQESKEFQIDIFNPVNIQQKFNQCWQQLIAIDNERLKNMIILKDLFSNKLNNAEDTRFIFSIPTKKRILDSNIADNLQLIEKSIDFETLMSLFQKNNQISSFLIDLLMDLFKFSDEELGLLNNIPNKNSRNTIGFIGPDSCTNIKDNNKIDENIMSPYYLFSEENPERLVRNPLKSCFFLYQRDSGNYTLFTLWNKAIFGMDNFQNRNPDANIITFEDYSLTRWDSFGSFTDRESLSFARNIRRIFNVINETTNGDRSKGPSLPQWKSTVQYEAVETGSYKNQRESEGWINEQNNYGLSSSKPGAIQCIMELLARLNPQSARDTRMMWKLESTKEEVDPYFWDDSKLILMMYILSSPCLVTIEMSTSRSSLTGDYEQRLVDSISLIMENLNNISVTPSTTSPMIVPPVSSSTVVSSSIVPSPTATVAPPPPTVSVTSNDEERRKSIIISLISRTLNEVGESFDNLNGNEKATLYEFVKSIPGDTPSPDAKNLILNKFIELQSEVSYVYGSLNLMDNAVEQTIDRIMKTVMQSPDPKESWSKFKEDAKKIVNSFNDCFKNIVRNKLLNPSERIKLLKLVFGKELDLQIAKNPEEVILAKQNKLLDKDEAMRIATEIYSFLEDEQPDFIENEEKKRFQRLVSAKNSEINTWWQQDVIPALERYRSEELNRISEERAKQLQGLPERRRR